MRVQGVGKLVANMEKIVKKRVNKQRKNMTLACIHLLRESKKQVPVDFGHLRSSATYRVTGKANVKGEVGYGAVYAAAIHENKRAGKTGGVSPQGFPYKHWAKTGKWKYLEDPFKKESKKLQKIIAGKI